MEVSKKYKEIVFNDDGVATTGDFLPPSSMDIREGPNKEGKKSSDRPSREAVRPTTSGNAIAGRNAPSTLPKNVAPSRNAAAANRRIQQADAEKTRAHERRVAEIIRKIREKKPNERSKSEERDLFIWEARDQPRPKMSVASAGLGEFRSFRDTCSYGDGEKEEVEVVREEEEEGEDPSLADLVKNAVEDVYHQHQASLAAKSKKARSGAPQGKPNRAKPAPVLDLGVEQRREQERHRLQMEEFERRAAQVEVREGSRPAPAPRGGRAAIPSAARKNLTGADLRKKIERNTTTPKISTRPAPAPQRGTDAVLPEGSHNKKLRQRMRKALAKKK